MMSFLQTVGVGALWMIVALGSCFLPAVLIGGEDAVPWNMPGWLTFLLNVVRAVLLLAIGVGLCWLVGAGMTAGSR